MSEETITDRSRATEGLIEVRAGVPNERRLFGDAGRRRYEDETDEPAPKPARGPLSDFLAAEVSLRRAFPRRIVRRFQEKRPAIVVLLVPSSDWTPSVLSATRALLGDGHSIDFDSNRPSGLHYDLCFFVRHGTERTMGRTDMSARQLPRHVAEGGRVVGISHDMALLPPELVEGADAVVRLRPLASRDLLGIVRSVTGARRVPRLGESEAAGMSPRTLALALRPGMSGAEALDRLRSLPKRLDGERSAPDVPRLEDLAGYGAAHAWGLALVDDLRRHRADPLDVTVDDLTRSVLLTGPPGVGKTLYARALGRSLDVPLIETTVAEWQSSNGGYLSDFISAMRACFARAQEAARRSGGCAVLLIDEIDSVPDRRRLVGGRHDEFWTSVTNALLTLVEESAPVRRGIVLVAASNYSERLDPALVRPGRLSRTIRIDLPGEADRMAILRTALGDDLADADLGGISAIAVGASGATLANWVRNARAAARSRGDTIALADLMAEALPKDDRPVEALRSAAVHEAGHVIVAFALGVDVLSANVAAFGGRSGLTTFPGLEGSPATLDQVEARVTILLGGRAADEMFAAADVGSGGTWESDTGQATFLLAASRLSWGLVDGLLMRCVSDKASIASELAADPEARAMVASDLARLHARARAIVEERRGAVEAVASALVERMVMTGEQARLIASRHSVGGTDDRA